MKRFSVLFHFSFVFFLLSLSFAQTAKMSIDGKPQKASSEFSGVRDVNGRLCAMIKFVSDMDGFKYTSNNGVVRVDDNPGEDHVYLPPDERVIKIFKSGYQPLQIILSDYGIQLHPKEVWQIKIKGSAKIGDLLPVTFLVQPKDAIINVDGKSAQSGKAVKLSKGIHTLRISKQGFKTLTETITVSENNVLFNYTLSEVELQAIQIKSNPSGAQILLDGQDKGVTDIGVWQYPGTYQLKLTKPGYVEINKTINVTETGNNTFSYDLLKNSGSLSLTVTPSGVKILINKEDYSNRSQIELAPGRYKIEISKTGYHPQSESISIVRGQTLRKTYRLTAKTGKLRFSIQPLEAKVTLKQNGRTVQSWTGMKYLKNLQVGNYELECTASGYQAQIKHITIEEKRTSVIDVKLYKKILNKLINKFITEQGDTNWVALADYFTAIRYSKSDSFSIEQERSSLKSEETVKDIDGNVYKTVKIGSQVWMAENLRVTHYRNGDPIPNVTDISEWSNLSTGAYCAYNNDNGNVATYGLLYNWYAVNDRRNIAPAGWRVPTDEEWKKLEEYLGSDAGSKLKERGIAHWKEPNAGATNSSCFNALPSGYRALNGLFKDIHEVANFWHSLPDISFFGWGRHLSYDDLGISRHYGFGGKKCGFSVRCIRD